MLGYRIISADDHLFEPADLWTSRIDSRFKDRAPQLVRKGGGEVWVCEGISGNSPSQGGGQAGLRFEEPEKLTFEDTFENMRPGSYDPQARLKDMDLDGVDVSVVYPTAGLMLFSVPDGQLLTAIFATYNDWAAEFCRAFPKRLNGIAMVNADDVQDGIKELERCANMGLVGAAITVFPPPDRSYASQEYEPLWAAAQDLEMPLSLHAGTNRPGPDQQFLDLDSLRPTFFANVDYWVRMSLGDMIFSGVFERYPKLQVGAIEHELSWVPHFLDRIDYTYSQRIHFNEFWHRFNDDMLPSDYFHRNVFLGFQEDALGIRDRDIIGVDQLQWGSDYPHTESTFPRSQQILEEILTDCTAEEKAKIAGGNAARIYRID